MAEHISSMKCAHQRYKDAFTPVLAEFSAAIGQHNNNIAIDSAIHSLNNRIERFILACDSAMQLPSTLLQHIDKDLYSLMDAHQTFKVYLASKLEFYASGGHHINNLSMESAIKNLNEQHERFILACMAFRVFIDERFYQFKGLVMALPANAVDPSATVPAPVSPDNAQLRDCSVLSSVGQGDMESDRQLGDEADMPEEHNVAVSQALANLDLSRPEPEETVENNMAALQEMVDHEMAPSQLPSLLIEEHISSMKCAHQRYKDAFTAVLAEFSAALGQHNNDLAIDTAIHSLNNRIERFILACDSAMQLPFKLLQHIDKDIYSLMHAHQTFKVHLASKLEFYAAGGHHINNLAMESAIENLNKQHERFIFTCIAFRDFIDMRFHQVRGLAMALPTNAVHPSATILAPVSPDKNAQLRDSLMLSSVVQGDMESDMQLGDEANVPEKHNLAVSQALAGLDLNRPEPEETAENNMAALQETAASQVLPDLDPNKNA